MHRLSARLDCIGQDDDVESAAQNANRELVTAAEQRPSVSCAGQSIGASPDHAVVWEESGLYDATAGCVTDQGHRAVYPPSMTSVSPVT